MEKEIFCWCDLRWSNGSEYEKAGWERLEQKYPECRYTDGRQIYRKKIKDNLWQIYDCGKIKYTSPFG